MSDDKCHCGHYRDEHCLKTNWCATTLTSRRIALVPLSNPKATCKG